MHKGTLIEKGVFKDEINRALFKSKDICELLLGDTSGMKKSDIIKEFKKHVSSHLFIPDTVTEADSFIFYDVSFPSLAPHIKTCVVEMYAICHRSILSDYSKEGYCGNRADILAQMIEDALLNDKEVVDNFGIGKLSLDSVGYYNSTRFYGNVLKFSVPNFR